MLCSHFILTGPFFYSICPYMALWGQLGSLKSTQKARVARVFTLKMDYFFYLLLSKVCNVVYSSSKS